MTTILFMRAGGPLTVETGSYDCQTHKWNATSSRPATDKDLPYKLDPSIISLHKTITLEDEDPYFE